MDISASGGQDNPTGPSTLRKKHSQRMAESRAVGERWSRRRRPIQVNDGVSAVISQKTTGGETQY
jgi:hypothetical protein